jgi:pyruvate kinase
VSERFDLIATLGPSSFGKESALARAGATAFRVNASHVEPQGVADAVTRSQRCGARLPIVVDLQGAKMRVGEITKRSLCSGALVRFGVASEVVVPHPELFACIAPGETLGLDDDRLRFRVLSVARDTLEAECMVGGTLTSRRGVNVLEHPVDLRDLPPRDAQVLELLRDNVAVDYAVSFVSDGRELEWVRRRAAAGRVIAKIERRAALRSLDVIGDCADALWICRGDLGAQLGAAELARTILRLNPRSLKRPTVMAGQVFQHLTEHANPTRSEVCHLAELISRGYDGIVLSDETAIGRDPVHVVSIVAELIQGIRAVS